MRSDKTDIATGDLIKLRYPRTVDDFWHTRTMTKTGSLFDRILIPWGTVLFYIGRLSPDDEINASYYDATIDEAGYTPIVPWGWCINPEKNDSSIVAVSLSLVERI